MNALDILNKYSGIIIFVVLLIWFLVYVIFKVIDYSQRDKILLQLDQACRIGYELRDKLYRLDTISKDVNYINRDTESIDKGLSKIRKELKD